MAEKELFNPDMTLSPDASLAEECVFSMRPTIHKDGTPDADLDCPYDGTYCRQKHYRVTRWQNAVAYAAAHKKNHTFVTTEDMFYKCPLGDDVECIRKIRYEKIMKQR